MVNFCIVIYVSTLRSDHLERVYCNLKLGLVFYFGACWDVVPVARLEAFRALKLSRFEAFRALKTLKIGEF